MFSRLISIILGSVFALCVLGHMSSTQIIHQVPSDDSCGIFNCSASVDTSQTQEAPQCHLRTFEDGSQWMDCPNGKSGPVNWPPSTDRRWDCNTDGNKICGDNKHEGE